MPYTAVSNKVLRPKVNACIEKYLNMAQGQTISIGLISKGKCYIIEDYDTNGFYDVGSVSKTVTAHLVLKLCGEGLIDLNKTADKYLKLKEGSYPTICQLLTHTAGYHHLTPAEITLPSLIKHRYSVKNPYENCTKEKLLKALSRRRGIKSKNRYGYSDFAYAILAAVIEEVTGKPFADSFENFICEDLGLKNSLLIMPEKDRSPLAVKGGKKLPFWVWKRENPYLAAGGVVCNMEDVLKYLSLQLEDTREYITSAHKVCEESQLKRDNHMMCIGWHTYKRSNQLWHVGGVGTFRSSVIFNKKQKIAVAVLCNAKGKTSANAHYIAKLLYSELKTKRIKLDR